MKQALPRRVRLALLCAAVTQLGFLFKHKGANTAPRVELAHPLRSARELLSCRWFRLGLAVAVKILDDHGATFELTNRPEGGALARITLRVAGARAGSDPELRPGAGSRGGLHAAALRSGGRSTLPR